MALIEIKVDDREVLDTLMRLLRRTSDLTPVMRNIAQVLESETEGRLGLE